MRKVAAAVILATLTPTLARAGEIYGSITESGKPVAEGLAVVVACGETRVATATDKNGAYRLVAPDDEKCTLTLSLGGQSPSITIHSFEDSVRYNLVIEKKDGVYTLRSE